METEEARVPGATNSQEPKAGTIVCTCKDKTVSPIIDGDTGKYLPFGERKHMDDWLDLQAALRRIGHLDIKMSCLEDAIDRQLEQFSKSLYPEYNEGYKNGLLFAKSMIQAVNKE